MAVEDPKWSIRIGGSKGMGIRGDHQEAQSIEEIGRNPASIKRLPQQYTYSYYIQLVNQRICLLWLLITCATLDPVPEIREGNYFAIRSKTTDSYRYMTLK